MKPPVRRIYSGPASQLDDLGNALTGLSVLALTSVFATAAIVAGVAAV